MNKFFEELRDSLQGVSPEIIVNFDETNISDDPGKTKIVVCKVTKYPEKIIDISKSAYQPCLPALHRVFYYHSLRYVYKAEDLYDSWKESRPVHCRYNRSSSRWFYTVIFICDNLASHKAVEIVELREHYELRFLVLPPNSTYLWPLKRVRKDKLELWKSKHRGCIPKDKFPSLLKEPIVRIGCMSAEILIAEFGKNCIWPLNSEKYWADSRNPSKMNNNQSFQEYLSEKRTETCNTTKQFIIIWRWVKWGIWMKWMSNLMHLLMTSQRPCLHALKLKKGISCSP